MKTNLGPTWLLRVGCAACMLFMAGPRLVEAQAQQTINTTGIQLANPDACAKDPVCWFHAERARELSKQGLLTEALKEYQAAFGLQPMPRLIFNIARIQQKMGRLDDALRSYELYLNLGAENNQEFAAKARSYIDEIEVITEPPPAALLLPLLPPPPPLHKRWWFWTVVGVSVAGVTAGIVAAATPRPVDPTQDIPIFRPF